jgi:hypothetical protein
MNIIHTNSAVLVDSSARHSDARAASRLIILIPTNTEFKFATRRISDLAHACRAQVLCLGLCKDTAQELSLRRELVTLSALLQDARVCAESKVEAGTNWVEAVKASYREGDMIVCFAEQRAGLFHRPLSQILASNLNAPVYILSSISPQYSSPSDWRSQVLAWAGSLGIILVFFLLQIQIASLTQDWAETTLLILSVIAEIWLIGGWNRLLG